MKPVIVGLVIAVITIVIIVGAGLLLLPSRFFPSGLIGGGNSQPPSSPSITTPLGTYTPPVSTPPPPPTAGQPTADVKFELAITGVSGSGLSRTITGKITNAGSADAHNVWLKVELFSQGERIKLNKQDYFRLDIGTIKAKGGATAEATLSLSPFDGLKVATSGAKISLTIYSDENTQTFEYDYKP